MRRLRSAHSFGKPSSEDKPNQESIAPSLSCSDPPNSAPPSSLWAMTVPLLRQLLAVIKALILASKRLGKDTWNRLVRKAALLWRILCTTLRIGTTKKRYAPKKPGQTTTHETKGTLEKPTTTTTTIPGEQVIPLDSRIAASRHPLRGPYLNTNLSQASLQHGLRVARSAHSVAVSSRNASRSNLALSPEAQSFTFEVKGPDHPLSPTNPRRQYSLSSPQLGGSGSGSGGNYGFGNNSVHGYDIEVDSLAGAPSVSRRTLSLTPPYSLTALPAGEVLSVHGSISHVQLGHDRIFPIVPEFFQRYERATYAKKQATELTIPALTLDYRVKADPIGWKPILHPEGVMYFYNEAKKTVTEANLYDQQYYDKAMETITIIEEHIASNDIHLPPNYTLALDINLTQSKTSLLTDYYFADHDRKILFFLDDLDAHLNFPVWQQVEGVTSLYHVRHELEAQYWMHGILYPNTVPVTSMRVNELRDTILHYLGDFTTSAYSTSPYNSSDLNTMLGQVNSLAKLSGGSYQGASSLLCRMNLIFSRQKFYNWHGLPEARIYRDKSVYQETRQHKTWLVKILSPLLFSAPDVHLKNLERMWVDGIMHQAVWLESIKRLNEEWTEFILYATVLLNANVAFLAIQSVDIHGGDTDKAPDYRSPTQVACYLSIISSIGSIVLGLLLLRQNRTRAHGTTDDVNKFLHERSHPTLGLETLAILYSLPYALLLWGMVSFLSAFAWNCFDVSNISTRVIMAVAWGAFAVLVVWCVWMGWVKHESSSNDAKTADADIAIEVDAPNDEKSGSGDTTPAGRPGSTRAGAGSRAASRASSRASRPGSRLSRYPPVQARPGSRLSQMSRVSGAPVHVPMTPVREATLEPKVGEDTGTGAGAGGGPSGPSSTGVVGVMRSLWSWPVRLISAGVRRRSLDSERTVTSLRPGDV